MTNPILKWVILVAVAFWLVVVLAISASAAVLATWSGPGPNACVHPDRPGATDCSLEWAQSQLSDRQRVELDVMMRESEPQHFSITNGMVFDMMTYAPSGKPTAIYGPILAVLAAPQHAHGWSMGSWAFVRISSCGNWAVLRLGEVMPIFPVAPEPITGTIYHPQTAGLFSSGGFLAGGGFGFRGGVDDVEVTNVFTSVFLPPAAPPPPTDSPPASTPAVVPLPATGALLAAGLGALLWARRRA